MGNWKTVYKDEGYWGLEGKGKDKCCQGKENEFLISLKILIDYKKHDLQLNNLFGYKKLLF